jgi:hypothetical protein
MCIAATTTSRSSNLKELKKRGRAFITFADPRFQTPPLLSTQKALHKHLNERSLAAAGSEFTALSLSLYFSLPLSLSHSLSPFFSFFCLCSSAKNRVEIFFPRCVCAHARADVKCMFCRGSDSGR